jgi:hypothetical protein
MDGIEIDPQCHISTLPTPVVFVKWNSSTKNRGKRLVGWVEKKGIENKKVGGKEKRRERGKI